MSKRSPDQNEQGEWIVITDEVRALAVQIRDAFIEVRRSYFPNARGVSRQNKRAEQEFLLAAQLCQQLGESARVFVIRQLEEALERGVPPYPSILADERLVAAARSKLVSKRLDSCVRYKFQLALFADRASIFSAAVALTDDAAPFSPLFRYCMATRLNLPAVAARYRDAAVVELSANPVAADIFVNEVRTL